MTGHAVKVYGLPAPKGSLKCIGGRGKVRHQLVEDKRVGQKEWRARVVEAGQMLRGLVDDPPMLGPIAVDITFTLPLPKSVKPESRPWPTVADSRDLDKLVRLVLDGLEDSNLFRNDAQVVELTARKAYPHTPTPDVIPAGGALIRISEVTE